MKGIWSKIYLGLSILGMLIPMQAKAAEQDTVTLQQEKSRVAVSLGISNAKEEKISTISVSLNVNVDGQSQAVVAFDFDSGLDGVTEHDFIFNTDNSRMDIYVSSLSSESLFGDGELKLGYVRVEPSDASQVLQVEVSYQENSFQAANVSYGSKTPVISSLPEPVVLQVGAGVNYDNPVSAPDGGSDGGDGSSGSGGQSTKGEGTEVRGQDADSEDNNMNQGLYDETTRFSNNPADAQNISAAVIRESNIHPELVDMSKGAAAVIGGKSLTGGSGTGGSLGKVTGNVSVISPEEGPDSILIAGSGSGTMGVSSDSKESEKSASGAEEGEAGGQGQGGADEIRLDKKNGGVFSEKGSAKAKWIIAGTVIIVGAVVGIGALIFVIQKRKHESRRRKKSVRRKKRKPAGKRNTQSRAKRKSASEKERKSSKGR